MAHATHQMTAGSSSVPVSTHLAIYAMLITWACMSAWMWLIGERSLTTDVLLVWPTTIAIGLNFYVVSVQPGPTPMPWEFALSTTIGTFVLALVLAEHTIRDHTTALLGATLLATFVIISHIPKVRALLPLKGRTRDE